MSTNIKVSITDSGIVTPDTGAFTNLDSGHAAMLGGGALILIFAILGIIIAMKKRSKCHFTADGKRKLGFKTTIGFSIILLAGLGIATSIVNNSNLDLINPISNTSAIIPEESLTVTAEDINLELSLDKDHTTAYQSVANKVTVSTPNKGGYTLKAYTTGTDLTRTDSGDDTKKISIVEGTNKALTDNTWGIATTQPEDQSSTVWNTMSTTESEAITLRTTTSSTESTNTTVYYGAYVTNDLPQGIYEGVSINYVAVSNPAYIDNIDELTYMQDFATLTVDEKTDVLNSMTEGEQYQLKDSRDNKSYYISRLKDGNIWMTQNLDLDLNSAVALTSEDTDLNEAGSGAYAEDYSVDSTGVISWAPKNSTITSINTSIGKFNGWANNYNVAYSADPDAGNPDNPWYATGEAYNSNLCHVSSNTQTCNYLNANNTVAPTYFSHNAFTGNGNHGKIGNYYNWSAAIASNNSSGYTTNTQGNVANNPQNSICPKGWRLPTVSSVAAKSEFARLNNVYNSGSTSNGTGLINSPVYMVRSGYVNDGALIYAGYVGSYWSSTVYNASYAYYLIFRSDVVVPAYNNYYRYAGRSVRCVSDY